jgi:hypothetical protein
MPLSTIFQLYRGGKFYCKSNYQKLKEKKGFDNLFHNLNLEKSEMQKIS